MAWCLVCGDMIEHCRGHDGDAIADRIRTRHENGEHRDCHPNGCVVAEQAAEEVMHR